MRRRTFLRNFVAAGATALNFFYPDITKVAAVEGFRTQVSGDRKQDPDYDPDFAGGRVVKKMSEGIILEVGNNEFRAVRIAPDATIWKEFEFRPSEAEIGIDDFVDARGINLEDDSLLAQQLWINIGRLDGIVDRVSPTGLTVINRHGQLRAMEVSSKLEVVKAKDGSPLPNHLLGLSRGYSIGSVGLRLPNDGYRATKIWLWEAEA